MGHARRARLSRRLSRRARLTGGSASVLDSLPPGILRIATFNVENLGKPIVSGATLAERIRLLRPQLLRLRADVLCLQEVDSERPRGGRERQLAALDALLADTPYDGFHRVSTVNRSKGHYRDKHNLVILSRLPIAGQRQILHDLVAPPLHRSLAADPEAVGEPVPIEWDRPVLHAQLRLNNGLTLHVVSVHLRAPRAAF